MFDWQDFRPSFNRCKDLHNLFPGIPLMALSATVTPQVQTALESFLNNPVVENSSVNRNNIRDQEYGRAGRDGKQLYAHILYSDTDISHVGFWARDMAKQHCHDDIQNSAHQFSKAFAHLSGSCRRKLLIEMFGEKGNDLVCPDYCCDVCERAIRMEERAKELKILIQAIDELGKLGEVKITEWIRGGQLAWMKDIQQATHSTHGKSTPRLSKEWWRMFIRQCAAAGYISRDIKPATFGNTQLSYASLNVTEKGRG